MDHFQSEMDLALWLQGSWILSARLSPGPGSLGLGTLGLEEGQATPESFPQELHIGSCGRILKGG